MSPLAMSKTAAPEGNAGPHSELSEVAVLSLLQLRLHEIDAGLDARLVHTR
jgi:hypothetical protein